MREPSRRDFFKFLGVSAAACAFPDILAAQSKPPKFSGKRPNIILVLTDDQGYGDLGRHGNPVIKTPNLDRLFDESVRFDDFHVSPTCAPTRCSLLTGKHEFKSGVSHTIYERERMSLKAVTLAQVLKDAGYATGIFGKWHLGDEDPYLPGQRGFDEVFIHGGGGIGQTYPGACGDAPGNSYFNPVILHNGAFEKTEGYCTDVFFKQAQQWIGEKQEDKPFFCYVSTNAPHSPLDVPPEYEAMYADLEDKNAAKFFGMVTNIDDNIGRLLAQLTQQGMERETLVIFMNDNGGTAGCGLFNAGMKGSKLTAHNGGTRAMSLWHWPGTLEPASVAALTAHLDIFPTLAELAGAKIPAATANKLDGYSLLPLLLQASAPWHEERMLFTHVGRWEPGAPPLKFGPCSVRWKQYLYFPAVTGGALFDLKADPGETKDIAATQPEVAKTMAAAYDRWWEETLPGLDNEEAYKSAPKVNPFKEKYWKQFNGPGPNNVPVGVFKSDLD